MHHDPLSSSKSKKIFHWGHDWVDLCIVVANPWWAPSKVFSLPICMRLYRNRQGLKKGKNKSKKKTNVKATKAASKKGGRKTAAKKPAAKKPAAKKPAAKKPPATTKTGRLRASAARVIKPADS